MSIKCWDNTGKHWDGNLFGETAEKKIESWVDTWVDKNGDKHQKILSTSQLRKYYNEIKNLENRFINLSEGKKVKMEEAWKDIHPLLIMVKAKISYDIGRGEAGVTKGFKKYLEDCIDSVNNYKDFEAFTKFFEACVGYYYEKTANTNQNQNKSNPQNQQQSAQQRPQQAKHE